MKIQFLRRIITLILALLMLIPAAAAFGTKTDEGELEDGFIKGEYIIQYDNGQLMSPYRLPSMSPMEVLIKFNAETIEVSPDGLALVTVKEELTQLEEQDFIQELEKLPSVKRVEKNRIVSAFIVDNEESPYKDPLSSEQWGTDSVRAFTAWSGFPENMEDMSTVRIAVIDTGVDSTHPDLAGRVIEGRNTLDTNSSGQRYDENDTTDDHGHGTHVSGIIAAVCGNAIGIEGVMGSAKVEILPVKALNDAGNGTTYSLVNAINYAADKNAGIISLSLGSSFPSDLEREAIRNAQNRNCLIIAASGNDSANVSTTYPASYDDVISVGSVDRDDSRSYFSNYGATLDISAPGSAILSTIPKATAIEERASGDMVYGDDSTGYYTAWSGTSMATPHVSAVAALYKALNPSAMNYDIGQHLLETARDVGDIGKDIETGAGVVDAAAALGSDMIKTALRLLSPGVGSELYETVNFRVQVNIAMGIKGVDFYLNDTQGTPIANIVCDTEDSYYDCVFDTKDVNDGTYNLIAVAYDDNSDPVGDPGEVSITILNHILDGFTLKISRPDDTPAGNAYAMIFGEDAGGEYHWLKSAYSTGLGFTRVKGLNEFDNYLVLVNETYTGENGSAYYAYRREISETRLGETIMIDASGSKLTDFSMKGSDGTELSRPYLILAPAYELGEDAGLLTSYSAWRISPEDKIYLDEGLYATYAYWSENMNSLDGQAGTAYYLSQWLEVEGGDNSIDFDYSEAVLVRPVFDAGISGTLRLEQISGKSVIPFFNGAISGSEIYLPEGEYSAYAELTATKEGKSWSMQLSKPEAVEAVGELVNIPFSANIRITEFSPNSGLLSDGDIKYMYRGDTLRTKNALSDTNGNIIKNISDNYPSFSIYKISGEQETLVYTSTDRYLSEACHWFSSSNYIGSTAPGGGTYRAKLSFDPSPFSEMSEMSFEFELRDKDGIEKQGVNLKMGGYHFPQAQADIYAWEGGGWKKANANAYTANAAGYLEIPKNLSLSGEGLNLAVIRYTQRQSGYNYPETYIGYQIVPFSQLPELETLDLPEGSPVTVNNYDKNGNRLGAALYLPIMSDAGGKLAKNYFAGLVRLDISNSYGGYSIRIPQGEYEYAFTSFSSVGDYYYLRGDNIQIDSETTTLNFDGRVGKKLDLGLPAGYSTYSMAPNSEIDGFVIYASSATSFLLSPGEYKPSVTVNSGDKRLSITAGTPIDLSASNQSWSIDDEFTPAFTLSSSIVPMNESLNVNGAFEDEFGNLLTASSERQNLEFVPYNPLLELTDPQLRETTLDAAYQSFIIPSTAYGGAGYHSFIIVYDDGRGERRSESIGFSVDDGYVQITVEQDDRYTYDYGDAGELVLTMTNKAKGFSTISAQIAPAAAQRKLSLVHERNGKLIGSITGQRPVLSEGSNAVHWGLNLKPGDTVTIKLH